MKNNEQSHIETEDHNTGTLNTLHILAKILILIISIGLLIVSVLGLLFGQVKGNTFFMWCGQLSPMFFISNILLTIYWLFNLRSSRFTFLINLIPAAIAFPIFINISFGPQKKPSGKPITVLTYNVHYFENVHKKGSSAMEIGSFLYETNSDIICLQEYAESPYPDEYKIPELLTDYPYTVKMLEKEHWRSVGNIIISKYPLYNKKVYTLAQDSLPLMISADALINNDTVRIFSVRLITTTLTQSRSNINKSNSSSVRKKLASREIIDLVKSFNNNAIIRHMQVDYIKKLVNASPHPVILCGDMNDTPMSYTYKTLSQNMNDCFKEAGKGHSYTYQGFMKMFRIDYVFHTKHFYCNRYESPNLPFSDHNPVIVQMHLSK